MVSVEELRREREQIEESDLIYQINVALEEGKKNRIKISITIPFSLFGMKST